MSLNDVLGGGGALRSPVRSVLWYFCRSRSSRLEMYAESQGRDYNDRVGSIASLTLDTD